MWTRDPHDELPRLRVPFATSREAIWARKNIGDWQLDGIEVSLHVAGRFLLVALDVEAPDSYSPEWEEQENDPDAWAARTEARLASVMARFDQALAARGLVASDEGEREPAVEERMACARIRRERRNMPPRRNRACEPRVIDRATDAGFVAAGGKRIGPSTTFCHFRTGEAVPRVGLLVGEIYWMTTEGHVVATVDVAPVDAASLALLAAEGDAPPGFDLEALLSHELQYGPLDVSAAKKTMLRQWLNERDALSTEAGPIAVANSMNVIFTRRGEPCDASRYVPWAADPTIVVRR